MRKVKREWVVVGSSPSAPDFWPTLGDRLDGAPVTITANRGAALFNGQRPDFYFLGGEIMEGVQPFTEHLDAGRELQKAGSTVVGIRGAQEFHEADLAWFNEYLNVDVGHWGEWRFHPGHYTAASLSGLFCLQFAANHNPAAIHCIGMEGYGDGEHYFDGSPNTTATYTPVVIEPFTQALIDACPDIPFTFYGNLEYDLTAQNVTITTDLPCESNSSSGGGDSAPTK